MSKFQELINGDKPVLVDFYADWCGPCRIIAPILKEVKSELGDDVNIIKIDVDKNPAASSAFAIQGIPTMILFKSGQQLWRQSGVVPKEKLSATIKNFIG